MINAGAIKAILVLMIVFVSGRAPWLPESMS